MKIKDAIYTFGSKTKLAAELGVTEMTIRNWEKADSIPRVAQLAIQTLSKNKLKAED
jgi:DNA-binding transcriptional regulator YiaG